MFEGIKDFDMVHKVLTRLEQSYEGTSNFKCVKLYIFKDKYAKFKMNNEKSALEMFHRLNVIMNELGGLGKKCKRCRLLTQVPLFIFQEIQDYSDHDVERIIEKTHSHTGIGRNQH